MKQRLLYWLWLDDKPEEHQVKVTRTFSFFTLPLFILNGIFLAILLRISPELADRLWTAWVFLGVVLITAVLLRFQQLKIAGPFAVTGMWLAQTNDRPYRQAWSEERAAAHLRENAGAQFDPAIVAVFLDSVLQQGALKDRQGGADG